MTLDPEAGLFHSAMLRHRSKPDLCGNDQDAPHDAQRGVLPSMTRTSLSIPMPSYGLTKRGTRFLLLAIILCSVLPATFYYREAVRTYFSDHLPPLYEDYREREQKLGHYKDYETRKDVKYLWSANHAHSSGWGNVMQDYVMNALLAHSSGRSFVFDDYIWNPDGSLFTDYNGHLIPSRIPLTALLGGKYNMINFRACTPLTWTVLGVHVSKTFFNKVCPNPTIVRVSEVNDDRMRFDESVPSSYVFEKWLEKLNSIENPCVEIDQKSQPILNTGEIFGHERMLSIWKYLKDSPVSTHWDWSPLIHDAYRRNRHIFVPNAVSTFFQMLVGSTIPENYTNPIPGLLALHVRRGDFENHCVHLGKWSSNWNAFNMFPEFSDKFERPTDGGWGETSEKNMQMYMQRCFPTIDQIVEKVMQVRAESEKPLTHIYIMTNGAPRSQRHVEQKFVVQSLDMLVAQRAEVLIGNGWSSLTSNVVMLRMAHGLLPDSNRFW
ncbi:hypothetical protein BDR07DRAFT_1451277 [Suillus spraguei]|nr:hypothetical protein BDR07DRAFT_1451277 [Suillus spraguei]